MMPCVLHWQTCTGAPDYVNQRINDQSVRAPAAKDGTAQVGLYMPYPNSNTLEFIEVQLSKPLVKGQRYKASVHVAQDKKHYPYSIGGMGLLFTPTRFKQLVTKEGIDGLKQILTLEPQVVQPIDQRISAKNQWVLIENEFVADGSEAYLIVGRFAFQDLTELENEAYYYFDDLQIAPVFNPISQLIDDNSVILDAISFSSGSSEIPPSSFSQINELLKFLQDYPGIQIGIHGFTDQLGDSIDNIELSVARANALKQRLVDSGVSESRLAVYGHGETPSGHDGSDARRIEIEVESRN